MIVDRMLNTKQEVDAFQEQWMRTFILPYTEPGSATVDCQQKKNNNIARDMGVSYFIKVCSVRELGLQPDGESESINHQH